MSEWPSNISKCLCGSEPTGETRLAHGGKYEHRLICEGIFCSKNMSGDWMWTKRKAVVNWNHIIYMNAKPRGQKEPG